MKRFILMMFLFSLTGSIFDVEKSAASTGAENVGLYTGAFTYSYPIDLPPGKMKPSINLSYNSQSANGWLGLGWSITSISIYRDSSNSKPNYDDNDTFILNYFGAMNKLVKTETQTSFYEYHPEVEGSFFRIRYYPADKSWKMWDKYGTLYKFVKLVDFSSQGYFWGISKIVDKNGNYSIYDYNDNGETHVFVAGSAASVIPKTIKYGGKYNDSGSIVLAPTRTISFEMVSRTDKLSNGRGGFIQNMNKRLNKIYVESNGIRIKRYDFSYSNLSYISMPEKIEVYCNDNATTENWVYFTKANFKYRDPDFGFQTVSGGWPAPKFDSGNSDINFTWTYSNSHQEVGMADINGDGLPDHLAKQRDWGAFKVKLNNGSEFVTVDNWPTTNFEDSGTSDLSYTWTYSHDHQEVGFMDINGDGLPDHIAKHRDWNAFKVRLNSGSGFYPVSNWFTTNFEDSGTSDLNYTMKDTNNNYHQEVGFMDINGDGLPDHIAKHRAWGAFKVRLNNGSGFYPVNNWATTNFEDSGTSDLNYTFVDGDGNSHQEVGFIDINGDGLPDHIAKHRAWTAFKVRLNNGNGFTAVDNWSTSNFSDTQSDLEYHYNENSEKTHTEVGFMDINGDGLPDHVAKHRDWSFFKVRLNTGNGFAEVANWSVDNFGSNSDIKYVYKEGNDKFHTEVSLMDINGDGLLDYVAKHRDNAYFEVRLNKYKSPLLEEVTDGLGGKISVTYDKHIQKNRNLPFPVEVATTITTSDGMNNSTTMSYSYEGGLFNRSPLSRREFLGFEKVKATDPEDNYTETEFYQNQDSTIHNNVSILKGKIINQKIYQKQNTTPVTYSLLSFADYTYGFENPFDGVYFPKLLRVNNVLENKQTRVEYSYDNYGNVTEERYSGDLSVNGDEKTIVSSFYNDTSDAYLKGILTNKIVLDSDENAASETWYYYDYASNWDSQTLSRGLLTKIENRLVGNVGNSGNPKTTMHYDEYGNIDQEKDARENASAGTGNITSRTYDSTIHNFPLSITNSLFPNNPETFTYDYKTGNVLTNTNINNQTTTNKYDVFGRLTKVIGPDDSEDYPLVAYSYTIDDTPPNKIITAQRVNHGASDTLDTITFLDGFGRTIQTISPAPNSEHIVAGNVTYNSRGMVENSYLPFTTAGSVDTPVSLPTNPALLFTKTEYDALGRIFKITNTDNTYATKTYTDWTETVINKDASNTTLRTKDYIKDAYGRIIEVHEHNGNEEYITKYTYDTLGNLMQIENSKGEKTTITYDSLGRKTSMDDPQMGHWSYHYDLNGNLDSQTDNKNQTTELNYDRLNRIHTKTYPNSTNITYNYDSGDYAKGRLSSVQDLSGLTSFKYDKFGRNIQKDRNLNTISGTFSTKSDFDALGRETKLTYPDDDYVNFGYETNVLKTVKNSDNSLTYATLTYDETAIGKLSNIAYGNNNLVQTAYTYRDDNQRLNTLITTKTGNSTPYQSYQYSYDDVGNIDGIDDKTTSDLDQSFVYDGLDRLTTSLSPNSYVAKYYEYDRTGNIVYNPDSQSAEQSFAFEGDVSNATISGAQYCNGVMGQGLSFDGNDTVTIPNFAISHQALTVELWAMRSTGGSGTLVNKSESFGISCDANGNVTGWVKIGSSQKTVTSTGVMPENIWKYIVLTYDGSNVKLYVNATAGTPLSVTGNINNNYNPIVFGSNFTGRIDELNIWGKALTDSEIAVHYNSYPNRQPNQPNTPQPIPSDFTSGVSGTQYIFKFKAWDVNGDNLTYVIDWDVDNTNDALDTRSEVSNGTEVQVAHSWTVTQDTSFGIKYKAIDSHGAESAWSPTYYISIGTAKQTALEEPHLFGSAGILENSSYKATGTIGETVTGTTSNSTYIAYSGYTGGICNNNSLAVMQAGQSDPGAAEAIPPIKFTASQLETISGTADMELAINQYRDQIVKDKNGDMLISNNRFIIYDYENRPKTIATLATISGTATVLETTDMVYDFEGQRVLKTIKQNGSELSKTLYIGTVYEQTGSEQIKYIYAGGQRVALKSTVDGILYFHGDHIGSTNIMTDSSGNVARTTKYEPYGKTFSTSGTKDNARKFTGQVLDDNTGLYYYNARYYDPVLCQFITPDTFIQDPYDPQSLNRYAYCRNNPIMYTDPSGSIFGIDDLLFAGIVTAGALYGGTHGFTNNDFSQFDWTGAFQGAVAATAIVAAAYYSGFTAWAKETFDIAGVLKLEGQTVASYGTKGWQVLWMTGGAMSGVKSVQITIQKIQTNKPNEEPLDSGPLAGDIAYLTSQSALIDDVGNIRTDVGGVGYGMGKSQNRGEYVSPYELRNYEGGGLQEPFFDPILWFTPGLRLGSAKFMNVPIKPALIRWEVGRVPQVRSEVWHINVGGKGSGLPFNLHIWEGNWWKPWNW